MIEIITGKVNMPKTEERRYQKHPVDINGKKWTVSDSHNENQIIKTGCFENISLACHNLNKKYYRDNPVKK